MNLQASWLMIAGSIGPPLLIAWLGGYVVRWGAPRWGLLDRPNARKVHQEPMPLGGGLAIWAAVVGSFAVGQIVLWIAQSRPEFAARLPAFIQSHLPGITNKTAQLWGLLAAGTVLMLIGLWDDCRELHWAPRLIVQVVVAAFTVFWLGTRITLFIQQPWITWVLSILWIVALTNSFNMLDNMDGSSAGIAAIAALALAVFLLFPPPQSASPPQLFVGGFLLVIVGAAIGFLWHNRPPARVFMGDAGAYFLGYGLATATLLATYTTYQSPRPHAVLAPVCVMAVPLYDLVTVLWIRVREGDSPLQADKNHFTHRLVDLGLTKTQAVLTIYLTTGLCGLAALLLHRVDFAGAVIVGLLVLCTLALVNILETTARRKINP